ncbi:MAG: hypothetical protein AAF236_14200, partial [Verrucomicrobiota bacterium]
MSLLKLALLLGAIANFGILIASAAAPKALDWKNQLAVLPKLLRQMFWVYGAFIVLMIVSFGTITLANLDALAAGSESVGRWFCGLVAVFWLVRLFVGLFIFDAKPFLTNGFYKLG